MKSIFGRCFLGLSFLLMAADGQSAAEKVEVDQFKELIAGNEGIVLDVRTPEEVAKGTIGDASVINFYADDFERKVSLLPKEQPIYVYCRSGGRSGKTAKMLEDMGFAQVVDLKGGIGAWTRAGLPLSKAEEGDQAEGRIHDESAIDSAIGGSLPVLLALTTEWCAPCRAMKPVLEKLQDDLQGRAAVIRVDLDANGWATKRFGVEAVPTFVGFPSGSESDRISGRASLEELKALLFPQE